MHFTQQPMTPRKTRWFILVRFFWLGSWQVAFFEDDQITQLPLTLTFAFADKLFDLYEQWGVSKTMSDRAVLEALIESHTRGEFWINVGAEAYQKLRVAKSARR